jgi:putative methyltransferase (TIGR04325 family)
MWSGIYSSFDEVPVVGVGFDGRRFAEQTQHATRLLIEETRKQGLPKQTTCQNSLLPLLGAVAGQRSRKVSILDFGGGTGAAFVHILANAPSWLEIRFDVVETASACELGQQLFADESRIRFHTTLPERDNQFDIVHISSALQYVTDYRKTLVDLCGFKAEYFLLANLSAAAIPTYATAQRVYDDMVVPYWFLNLDEVIDIMESESYRLLWKAAVEREYVQANFPPEYRLGRTCNLLFRQDTDSIERTH